jgi:hypothetical protein
MNYRSPIKIFQTMAYWKLLCHFGCMGDNQEGDVFFSACRLEEIDHLLLMGRINTCGGLIGKKNSWPIC